MTTFPGSPRFLKGAIVGLDKANPLASVIVFQYNPERRSDATLATILHFHATFNTHDVDAILYLMRAS